MTPALAELPKIVRSYATTTVASVTRPQVQSTMALMAHIPAKELWLYLNADAKAALRSGIADALAGRLTEVESYEAFADVELDD